eukprot:scaffold127222_cov32-Tisochrysis_lutea.AAC.2
MGRAADQARLSGDSAHIASSRLERSSSSVMIIGPRTDTAHAPPWDSPYISRGFSAGHVQSIMTQAIVWRAARQECKTSSKHTGVL